MYGNSAFQVTSIILENVYHSTQTQLHKSMDRISSGKRIARPSDGVPEYFHIQQFKTDLGGLSEVKNQISFGMGFLKTADKLGSSIWTEMSKLKELLQQYYSSDDPTVQGGNRAHFEAIRDKVTQMISNGDYHGSRLIADGGGTPAVKVLLDPRDVSLTFNIEYGASETVNTTGLVIGVTDYATESAALQVQIDKVGNYLARTEAYSSAIDTYYTLTTKKITECQKNVERTEKIDEGAEMMRFSKQSIQQQMAAAMIAQANLFKSAIAALVTGINK